MSSVLESWIKKRYHIKNLQVEKKRRVFKMHHYEKNFIVIGVILVGLFFLFGCSGSSSSGDGGQNVSLSGYVVNGPLSGATVRIYDKDDFSLATTVTDNEGYFSVDELPDSPPYLITAQGGTLNGQPYSGTLMGLYWSSPCNLSPLTTAIKELSQRNGRDYDEVQNDLMIWLELSEDPFIADFKGEPLGGVDLEIVREAIDEIGLEKWVENMIDFYEDETSVSNFGKEWFGYLPPDITPESHMVDTITGEGGTIKPEFAEVDHGEVAVFTVTPDAGFIVNSISGCGGSLAGTNYTTSEITEECTIETTFILGSYTVSFVDYDGTQLSTQTVRHGSSATPPAEPNREGYIFVGWDTAFDNVTSDIVVRAEYGRSDDISAFISKTGNSSGVWIQGYWQAGSNFSLTITNKSSKTFNIKSFELTNGGEIISTVTAEDRPDLFNNGQLAGGESVGITITLGMNTFDNGFVAAYYLVDPDSYKNFKIEYEY